MSGLSGSVASRVGGRVVAVLASMCLLGWLASVAVAQEVSETSVKAAFVYNFAKFVNWSHLPVKQDEITLGVIGDRPLDGELWALAGRKVGDRRIRVVRIDPKNPQAKRKCELVFVSSKIPQEDPTVRAHLTKQKVLTISDSAGFAQRGGIIELYRAGTRVRFEIRNDAAKKSGVEISSKLLRLAVPRAKGQRD